MKNKHKVFVYGTLRKNERNHHLIQNAKLLAEQAWTKGTLFDTGYYYPAIKRSNENVVYGELFEVNDSDLARLDLLEGYNPNESNNLYTRVTQKIYTDNGSTLAYVYVMEDETMLQKQIVSGDWKVHQLLKDVTIPYFAYGSCMDTVRFQKANVDHYFKHLIGKGILNRYSLRFTRKSFDGGRADIVEDGGIVEGKVYEIQSEALPYLFRREGVNAGCYRPAIIEVKVQEQIVKNVLTFVVVNKEKETAPPAHYLEEILRGGRGFLSDEYLRKVENMTTSLLN